MRGGGQTGQRLAAKAQGGYCLQVLHRAGFAGGVAAEGQRQVFGRDAFAVVAHFNQLRAAFFQKDVYAVGAGVQGVFQQLFQRGGGALDDLARRDASGNGGGKLQDAGGHSGAGRVVNAGAA